MNPTEPTPRWLLFLDVIGLLASLFNAWVPELSTPGRAGITFYLLAYLYVRLSKLLSR